MDTKRFISLLLFVAAGAMLFHLYVTKDEGTPPSEQTPTTQPVVEQTAPAPAPPSDPAKTVDATAAQPTPSADTKPTAPALKSTAPTQADEWGLRNAPRRRVVIGSLDPEDGYLFAVTLDSLAAAVHRVDLKDFFVTVEDKRAWTENPASYPQKLKDDPKKYKGHYPAMLASNYKGVLHSPYATPSVQLTLLDDDRVTTMTAHQRSLSGRSIERCWKLVDEKKTETTQSATFEWAIGHNENFKTPAEKPKYEEVLAIRKTYTVTKDSYSIQMKLSLVNRSKQPVSVSLDQSGPTSLPREGLRADERSVIVAKVEEDAIQPKLFGLEDLTQWPFAKPESVGSGQDDATPVLWIAQVNKYFGSVMYLQPKDANLLVDVVTPTEYTITPIQASSSDGEAPYGRGWKTTVTIGDLTLTPNVTREIEFDLFCGPKMRQLFSGTPLYNKLRYIDTIQSKSCACTFDWLRDGLMFVLHFFAKYLFFGNFGLAIILLVLIVQVCLHPLTKYSQVSMMTMQKTMAKLKPEMERVRQKYANDPAKRNQELMKLQREKGMGVGQMMGCLPMFLNMPIWVALFSGLNTEVSLRHASFLPFWLTDLAAPDALISWAPIHFFGFSISSFNLLPLLVAGLMFLQMKSNPSMTGQGAAMSPEQESSQKMMRRMMPAMMLLFFYNMPSGLNLYIMSSNIFRLIEQKRIRQHIAEQEEAKAAQETVVQITGKGGRQNRGKKAKGPFWTNRS